MSNDIQPGDVAVCVNVSTITYWWQGEFFICEGKGLIRGRAHLVVSTFLDLGQLCVRLRNDNDEYEGVVGRLASRFRKLNDGEVDAELIARIKSCQPVKQDAWRSHHLGAGVVHALSGQVP